MTDYENMIKVWEKSVADFRLRNNIPAMELKFLKLGDIYDYQLFKAYCDVINSIDMYRQTPQSPLYSRNLENAIRVWYMKTAQGRWNKIICSFMPITAFIKYIQGNQK